MKKKDVFELKKRLKKDDCTFTIMCGCYVDSQKDIVLNIKETFLNLQEAEFFKYLEIAKKTLSGTIGNNLLELNFPLDDENIGGKQQSLIALKKSKLKDDAMLDSFYKSIIDSYDYTGNFLILIFHDVYDVITKTTDNSKLDESEEVYEYLLCAICPVSLSKPGLGYLENDNRIGARIRDWIVGTPDLGFIFPAFTDRSTDINSIMYYTKNPKDSHPELMETGLGCDSKQTATEQKEAFHTIIRNAIDNDDEKSDQLFIEIQENLNNMIDEKNAIYDNNREPFILTNDTIQNILSESGIPEEVTTKIEKFYTEEFGDTPPVVEHLIDTKALAANAQKKKEEKLEQQVQILQQKLEETKQDIALDSESESAFISTTDKILETDSETEIESENTAAPSYDVVLRVKPQKVAQIKSQIIDGKKCIIIPMDDNEQANVNGTNTLL
jgi:hypothetical protein